MDAPDKAGISLVRCNNERDLVRWDLDTIGQELTGKAIPRLFPIYLVFYQGQLCGYFQTVQQLVIYPAIHPDRLSPRTFVKVVRSLASEMKRFAGNPLFLLCEKAQQLGPRRMKMIRLKKADETAYIYDEEAR
jgi:hypothetical protein